jgi:hypothetical protein
MDAGAHDEQVDVIAEREQLIGRGAEEHAAVDAASARTRSLTSRALTKRRFDAPDAFPS